MNNNQEAFDKIWAGIKAQGEPSEVRHKCFYRGPGALKCAIGQLIPDEEYNPEFDSSRWDEGLGGVIKAVSSLQKYDKNFLVAMQRIHDDSSASCRRSGDDFISFWKCNMQQYAKDNELTCPKDS